MKCHSNEIAEKLKHFKEEIEKIDKYNANQISEINNQHEEEKIKLKIELEALHEKKVDT